MASDEMHTHTVLALGGCLKQGSITHSPCVRLGARARQGPPSLKAGFQVYLW